MKKYFLVTTALENTWPEDESEPTLFLGEWCRLYSRKERWEMMNVEVLPYHWDDRKKLFNDYQYLRALNERILESLANSLNQYHQVNYSLRYWRIVVGPWLMMVLPVLYDRWECIRLAVSTYEINKTYITDKISEDVTPVSMEHFSSIIMSDEWNHLMYAKVLDFMKFKRATKKKLINYDLCIAGSSCSKKSNINLFKKVISSTFSLMARNNEYFFIDTYLKKSDVVRLCLKLKQFPGMYQDEGYSSSCQIEMERLSMLEGFFPDNEFEGFVKKVLPLHMPIAYFEGYNQLIGEVKKKYWPSNSKVIWTSNSFYMNEHFKVWSAYKVEKGSSLVIGQHEGITDKVCLVLLNIMSLKLVIIICLGGGGIIDIRFLLAE